METNVKQSSIEENITYYKKLIQEKEVELSKLRMNLTLEEKKLQDNFDWGLEE